MVIYNNKNPKYVIISVKLRSKLGQIHIIWYLKVKKFFNIFGNIN